MDVGSGVRDFKLNLLTSSCSGDWRNCSYGQCNMNKAGHELVHYCNLSVPLFLIFRFSMLTRAEAVVWL